MPDKLRVGVMGCGGGPGWVGSNRGAYLGGLAEQTGLMQVVAVCDVVAAHAEWGAARLGGVRACTDPEAFYGAGLDAVIIATPVNLHASQAIEALERGVAVLSEVTPVNSLAEAAALAAAVERTGGFYMLAENYTYINDVELLKRLNDAGRFGAIHYGEGEYLHDTRDLLRQCDGSVAWRGIPGLRGGLYCTHSLAPLLYITGDRVATVSCLEPTAGQGNTTMMMTTAAGRVLRVRLDGRSPRPHNMAYYALQGDRGAYEGRRGLGDEPKVWLVDVHEPSKVGRAHPGDPIAQWHPLSDLAEQYIADRLAGPDAARTSGHFGADYWMLQDFASAVLEGRPSPRDVYTALDCTVPGILAMFSKTNGGAILAVPDFRPKKV